MKPNSVQFTDNSKAVIAAVRRAASEAVSETADLILQDTKTFAPVESGELRDSYEKQMTGEFSAEVGTPLERAIFSELGTSRAAAHPHLLPACEKNKGELIKKFKEKLK